MTKKKIKSPFRKTSKYDPMKKYDVPINDKSELTILQMARFLKLAMKMKKGCKGAFIKL